MCGRRILVPGIYFGNPQDPPYPGLVGRFESFTNTDLKKRWGYLIHYDAGDYYYMIETG